MNDVGVMLLAGVSKSGYRGVYPYLPLATNAAKDNFGGILLKV